MSALLINYTLSLAVSSVSTAVYYTAKGAWFLAKRIVLGRQPTAEEKLATALQSIAQREEEILQRQRTLEMQQQDMMTAMETQIMATQSQSLVAIASLK